MSIKHDHTLSPVTAVAFCNQPSGALLLAADGIRLKVLDVDNTQVIAQCKVFKEQAIHGIAVKGNDDGLDGFRVIIWGGPLIGVLYECDLMAILEGQLFDISSREFSAPDWILSVALSPCENGQEFLFLTAHNSLSRAYLKPGQKEFSLECLGSPCRSILYSAHMIWESSTSIIVAAGTVFGEIVVWHCHLGEVAKSTVLFTFTGHEGSIFGVHISPVFQDSKGKGKRVLSSCSDDRTIRLWDLSQEVIREEKNLDSVGQRWRETGFEGNGDTSELTIESDNRCLAVAWGHASRIWRVQTYLFGQGDPSLERIGLLSFGEDATCQLWSIDFQTFPKNLQYEARVEEVPKSPHVPQWGGLQLKHRRTFAYHSGKHIWAADVCSLHKSSCLIATGGADGQLSCFEISPGMIGHVRTPNESPLTAPNVTDSRHGIWTLEEILATFLKYENRLSTDGNKLEVRADTIGKELQISEKQKKSNKTPRDDLSRYSFVTDKTILLTSTAGRVILGSLQQQNRITWKEIRLPGESLDLRGYSVMTSIPELQLAVFAGANGSIYRYRNGDCIDQIGSVKGKVGALFLTRNRNDRQSLHLLVTVLGSLEASLFSWDEDGNSERIQCSSIFLPSKFTITGVGEIGSLMYLGSRTGAIAVLDPNKPGGVTFAYHPPAGEDADAVTSITEIPRGKQDSSLCHVLATSRNGTYKILSITTDNHWDGLIANISMVPKHHSSPPLGSIEDAWFEGSILYLSGFRGKQFIVWNETKQSEVMAVECGGAHRSYAYSHHNGTTGGGTFVYTKASKLYLHSQRTGSHRIIKEGGHGREIKACAISSENKYLATGAEDTTIRIWKYHDENAAEEPINNKFECLSVVEKHSTGIQHLQWQGINYLFSSGGVEEFYVWAIQEIPGFGVGIICEAALLDQSPEKDLRITSFDIMEFPNPDPQTNTILSEKVFLISLAYSDSTIKCYLYSKPNGFHRVAEAKYGSSCLTQIRYAPYPAPILYNIETSNGLILCCDIFLLTAGTDGHLTTWEFSLSDLGDPTDLSNLISISNSPIPMTRIKNHNVHENAIKSLDLVSLAEASYVVATGGDDNALAITYFGGFVDEPKTTIVKRAHSAAVTGMTFVGKHLTETQLAITSKGIGLRLVSSSNDQRIKLWNITVVGGGYEKASHVDMEVVGDEFTSIADAADIAVLREGALGREGDEGEGHGKVVVVGNGMDVWVI